MTLTVEDGTGLAGANAFVSEAYCTTYHADRGNSTWAASTYSTAQREAAIIRATDYLSEAFNWQGFRANARVQALGWPRYDVEDRDCNPIPSDEIPREIQKATAEVALIELVTPNVMKPTYKAHDRLKSVGAGPARVEYAVGSLDAKGARQTILAVRDLVAPLTKGGGSAISGTTNRV